MIILGNCRKFCRQSKHRRILYKCFRRILTYVASMYISILNCCMHKLLRKKKLKTRKHVSWYGPGMNTKQWQILQQYHSLRSLRIYLNVCKVINTYSFEGIFFYCLRGCCAISISDTYLYMHTYVDTRMYVYTMRKYSTASVVQERRCRQMALETCISFISETLVRPLDCCYFQMVANSTTANDH